MCATTRRGFIAGCSAAVAAYAGASFNTVAFGAPGTNDEILITLFLRGGMDSLSLVFPVSGARGRGPYESARPDIAIPLSGPNSALDIGAGFGLHRATDTWPNGTSTPPATLYDLYQDGKLSIVVAAGMHEDNRSHFDSMRFIELGTPGVGTTGSGWLARHLASATNLPSDITMPALAIGNLKQTSLLGSTEAINMTSPDGFSLNVGPYQWRTAVRTTLRKLYNSTSWLHEAGTEALDAIDVIELNTGGSYQPSNGAVYPNGSLGRLFQTLARMIKLDLGLRVGTIDFGGWDTHNGQGDDGGGYFYSHVQELSLALAAFYTDLDGAGANNYTNRLTLVVQSEFGRRLRQNADRGTDHGHGTVMLVLSGNATGGVHGVWPGLANEQLFDGADLDVTTDYRRVLSEILIRRLANPSLGAVFPGYTGYAPMGVVNGPDLTPIASPEIFQDSFETGNAVRWTVG